jgi:hypothetical protein
MTIKTGPNVSDHYMNEDTGPVRAMKQFILDAAIKGIMDALNGADDILDHNYVECSGECDGEPWQQFVVKFRHAVEDDDYEDSYTEIDKSFEFKLELNDSHDGYVEEED